MFDQLVNALYLLQIDLAERSIETVSQCFFRPDCIQFRWESQVIALVVICANICLTPREYIAFRVDQLVDCGDFFYNFSFSQIDNQQSTTLM